jgi:Ser/Thr protein kinase RdoA (MazF antagonist)
MEPDFYSIISRFRIEGQVKHAFPFGSGHINDSYKVMTNDKNFLLQRINHNIFKDIPGLTNNITRITDHLRDRLTEENQQVLIPVRTNKGDYILKDEEDDYWRVFDFIEGSKSYDRVGNPEIACEGGRAYGQFLKMLDDFPVDTLIETIPRFHDIEFRLENFREAVLENIAGRAGEVQNEIDFANKRSDEMQLVSNLGKAGKLPLRVTHNDTKINNVLFDQDNKAICVIDLDTVMPGYVHFDFGDAIRTFTNTADEDEKDLTMVSMNINLFEAFAKGFLSETKNILKKEEIETLAFSARLMTYIIGLRFLTDYLQGDVYYKTRFPGHNLIRARVQFRLVESMEEQRVKMESIIAGT